MSKNSIPQFIPLKNVYVCMALQKDVLNSAVITSILSGGLPSNVIRNLKVKDLINACSEGYSKRDIRNISIESLIQLNPEDIIPCWHYEDTAGKKDRSYGVTFTSPESLFYTFLHIAERLNDGIGLDDYLFSKTKRDGIWKPLTPNNITRIFEKSNDLNNILNNVGKHQFHETYDFRSEDLRHTFKETCQRYIPLDVYNRDDLIDLLSGTASKDNSFYKKSLTNINDIQQQYRKILPFLTAKNYVYQSEITADFKKYVHRKTQANVSDELNQEIITNHYLYKVWNYDSTIDEDEIVSILQIAFDLAKKDGSKFTSDPEYLDSLIIKSQIEYAFRNQDINVECANLVELDIAGKFDEVDEYDYAAIDGIMEIMKDLHIFELYNFCIDNLKASFKEYIEFNRKYQQDSVVLCTKDVVVILQDCVDMDSCEVRRIPLYFSDDYKYRIILEIDRFF